MIRAILLGRTPALASASTSARLVTSPVSTRLYAVLPRARETSMKMAEILTGARKTYGLNLIGGIRRDPLKDDMIQTRQLAQQMRRSAGAGGCAAGAHRTWNSAPSALVV